MITILIDGLKLANVLPLFMKNEEMNSNSTINYKSTAPLQLSTSNIIKAYTTIWFRSHDIIKTITNLRARGQEFLNIPDSYYDMLRKRLAHSKVKVGWVGWGTILLLEKLNIIFTQH